MKERDVNSMRQRPRRIFFRKSPSRILQSLFLTLVVIYFSYHILQGRYGLIAWQRLNQLLSERRDYLSQLVTKKEKLQKKLVLINNKVDLDLIEEEARRSLGFHHGNELVVLRKKPEEE